MREYLFRGKRADNGEWVEGDLAKVYNYDTQKGDFRCFKEENLILI